MSGNNGVKYYAVFAAMLFGFFTLVAPVGQSYAATDTDADAKAKKALKIEIRATRKEIRKVMKLARGKAKKAVRGAMVYRAYCVLCHGSRGDGNARMKKIHGDLPLKITKQEPDYYAKIIKGGGAAVGKSEFMPTWDGELESDQIEDLVMYLSMISNPVRRGEVTFKTNCILCHGVNGDGLGRASVLFDPPPANLTKSDKNDAYKKMIITMGGEAMGRSSVMPIWGQELSEAQIDDVVAFLGSILVIPPPD